MTIPGQEVNRIQKIFLTLSIGAYLGDTTRTQMGSTSLDCH
jgi:hypothetical protein